MQKILNLGINYTPLYIVFEDGRVYSVLRRKYLSGDITKGGYLQYTLYVNGVAYRIKAHRLVASLFLGIPENYNELVVNHKDGNKLNNHYTNLEWRTQYYNNYHARINNLNNISKSNSDRWKNDEFRIKTSKNISDGIKRSGCFKGENNPRFRYKIYDLDGNNYSRTDLANKLNLAQSTTDKLIRDASLGINNKYFSEYGIFVKDIKNQGQSTIEND